MEGLLALLAIVAVAVYVVLPICTFVAVRRLGARIESLENAVRELLRTRVAPAARLPAAVEPAAARAPAPSPGPSVGRPSAGPAVEPVAAAVTPRLPAPAPSATAAKPPKLPLLSLADAPAAPAVAPKRDVDAAGVKLLRRMWNWVVVGEEFRRPGLSAEFAIATTWLVRVGVLSVVLMVGFGLQLSIARGLLGPAGRVSLALVCGTVFILLGLRCLGRRYQMLGQGFVGGGLAMFYFAFFAAAMLFHLMPVTGAFACMAAVTAAAVVLAVRLEALSIAVFGLLGGYATPLMLRSAQPDWPIFYAYLVLLALGMAGVAVRRQWPVLTGLSLFFNSFLFMGSVVTRYGWHAGVGTASDISYLVGFFVIYSTALFVYAVRRRISTTPVELAALFVNALVALGGGALLIGYGPAQRTRLAVFVLGLAAFYVAHVWIFLWRGRFDRVLVSGFIALAVIFLGLAPPLLFTGHVLSAMFALLAVALLGLARRLESRMLLVCALGCYGIVLVRLAAGFLDLSLFEQARSGAYWVGLKDRLVEFAGPVAALFAGWRLFGSAPAVAQKGVGDSSMRDGAAFGGVMTVFAALFYAGLVIAVTREVTAVSWAMMPAARWAALTVVWGVFTGHLIMARARLSARAFMGLLAFAVTLVTVQWLIWGWLGAEWPVLDRLCHTVPFSVGTALPRLLATAVCVSVLVGARQSLGAGSSEAERFRLVLLTAALVAGLLYLTFEAATCCTAYVPGFRGWAVSVVWICYGLSLLVGGLRCGSRGLRLAGLALFCVTVAKVFLSDLADSDVLGRLIAFGVVGGVLLLAAYAYLRNQNAFNGSAGGGREDV